MHGDGSISSISLDGSRDYANSVPAVSGAHIGFVARQLAGELRHLRRDDTANNENNRER
jgi:hypothetical protein